MKFKLLLINCVVFLISCEVEKADMIIHNGKIYTMNDLMPITEAVAINNGKIIALGKYKELDYLISPNKHPNYQLKRSNDDSGTY